MASNISVADIDLLLVSPFSTAQRYVIPPVMRRWLSLGASYFTETQLRRENITGIT
jgi:hypothetical protein